MAPQKKLFSFLNHASLLQITFSICLLAGIPLIIFLLSPTVRLSPALSLKKVAPTQNMTNVGIFTPITVTFAQPASLLEKKTLTLESSPIIEGATDWTEGNTQLRLIPSVPLLINTRYTITLKLNTSILYSWNFKTTPLENVSIQDQERTQGLADEYYNKEMAKIDKQYPWLDKLPLQTDAYFFYFDIEKKGFVGQLYPKETAFLPIDEQVKQIKSQIMSSLTTMNIPITNYPFFWEVTPEP